MTKPGSLRRLTSSPEVNCPSSTPKGIDQGQEIGIRVVEPRLALALDRVKGDRAKISGLSVESSWDRANVHPPGNAQRGDKAVPLGRQLSFVDAPVSPSIRDDVSVNVPGAPRRRFHLDGSSAAFDG